jgi:hypothetical protein
MATDYTNPQEYMKFLKRKCLESHSENSPCEGCKEGCAEENCSCCPPGLVAVYDDKGNHTGCLTPNDAELYKKNSYTCEEGFVKLFRNATGEFLGCVSEDNFATLYSSTNPA